MILATSDTPSGPLLFARVVTSLIGELTKYSFYLTNEAVNMVIASLTIWTGLWILKPTALSMSYSISSNYSWVNLLWPAFSNNI